MKIIKPYIIVENRNRIDGARILEDLERYGRKCYQSEGLAHGKKFVIKLSDLSDKEVVIDAWEQPTITNDYLFLSEEKKEALAKKLGFDYIPQVSVPLLRIIPASSREFIKKIIDRKHYSILEHEKITVSVICDRGVTHEIVRHRIASYSQESTRYCNYSSGKFGKEITVIMPCFWDSGSVEDKMKFGIWESAMKFAEESYLKLIELGATPQEARSVLPNSLKTEIVITFNLRQWRHFFTLRCSSKAHPQMREVAFSLFEEFREMIPVIFDDIVFE